jgi:hypothetical protein
VIPLLGIWLAWRVIPPIAAVAIIVVLAILVLGIGSSAGRHRAGVVSRLNQAAQLIERQWTHVAEKGPSR